MRCDLCGEPLENGQEITVMQPGQMVNGVPQPTEEAHVQHEDCGDF